LGVATTPKIIMTSIYAQVVEELAGGAVTRQYTYGLQRISQNQLIANVWPPSFYGYDGGGNVRSLTNTAGAITDEYEYDAYGNAFTKAGSTPNVYLYRGEQFDPDLGLYYLRARYYNQLTGRFVSRDAENGIPTDPKTLHKYVYADGDPVNWADPTGRTAATATRGGAAGEYEGLITDIALSTIVAVDAYVCRENISLAMEALQAQGYVDVVPAGFCSAKGRQRWTCIASGHYVEISTQNTTLSPDFTGYGNSETDACQAALDAFQSSAPLGSYPRHGQCKS
jgi:RHS repeat-associated protein